MNSIIQRVPEVIPTAYVVSSEGLDQQGDGFHFTSESHRIFGKRYAEVMLSILDGTTPIAEGPSSDNTAPITAPITASEEPDKDGYYFHNTFERGTDSWENRGYASVSQSNNDAYEGSGSLYCDQREYNWSGASRSLSSSVFEPGKEFSFSVMVKYTEGPESQIFYLTLQYDNGTDEVQYDKIATVNVSKGQWVQLANSNYKIPANASNLVFYVETDEELESFYIDEAIGAAAGTNIEGSNSNVPFSSSADSCWSIVLGYPCCTSATEVYEIDDDGQWSVEDNHWCGIPN